MGPSQLASPLIPQCSAFLKYQRSNIVKSCQDPAAFLSAWGRARGSWSHLIRTASFDKSYHFQQKSIEIAQAALMPTPGTIFSAMYKAVWALVCGERCCTAYQRLSLCFTAANRNILEEKTFMCRDCGVQSWSDTIVQVLLP